MGRCGAGTRGLSTLDEVLKASQARGYLGGAPITHHRAHAEAFAAAMPSPPARAVDLGTGGGVPALVLAELWQATQFVLIDADSRRTGFLDEAVLRLGWAERMHVVHARAEDAGRDPDLRGSFDFASARSFGSPAVTAECAAPFLVVGGTLVVSDPPEGGADRWPAAGVAQVGLEVAEHREHPVQLTALRQALPCPEAFARRAGLPSRRPLF
jgi:16S rRNA (guanine527-N7)-methyltransferase